MGVDFSIITMLDAKADMDTTSLQYIFCQTDIPSCDLKHMKQIGWQVFIFNRFVHKVSDRLHLESAFLTVSLSKALLLEDALIVETFFFSELFEAIGYTIETITDDENEEVIFTEVFLA